MSARDQVAERGHRARNGPRFRRSRSEATVMAGSARRLRQLPMRAAFALDGELVDHLGVDLDLFAEPPVLVGESASWPAQRQERQGVRGCRRALAKGRGLSLPACTYPVADTAGRCRRCPRICREASSHARRCRPTAPGEPPQALRPRASPAAVASSGRLVISLCRACRRLG
jgi:hypothetical protein